MPPDQLDQQYTAEVQADNADDLSTYTSAAKISQDPRVRKLAEQQSARVRAQGGAAEEVARGIGIPAGVIVIEAVPAGASIPA